MVDIDFPVAFPTRAVYQQFHIRPLVVGFDPTIMVVAEALGLFCFGGSV
jgi:hypothetical protein